MSSTRTHRSRWWRATAALDGTYDPDAAAIDDAPSPFVPIAVGDKGVMYLRVYRKSGGSACDYKIDVSN